jgi:outer membrane receptor for ferrienterochelin and colicins
MTHGTIRAAVLSILLLTPVPDRASAQQDTARVPADTVRVRHEPVIVQSTRTGRRLEDEPLRIEVVSREEIEEKLLMTPGDIAMLLNETGGIRMQATAPAFGGATIRIHGLRGRYSRILADGLPLYGDAGGLGALQIPPMDLAQVEVIKGAASALYGASALGGVVNLISRRPDGARELLLNATTRGGFDGVGWLASRADAPVGWTVLAGAHTQARSDVSGDGWADMPGYDRAVIRPRIFLGNDRASAMLTAGVLAEDRHGGLTLADAARDRLETRRVDAGLTAATWLRGQRLAARASVVQQRHAWEFPGRTERDVHRSAFGELALSGSWLRHTWVLGAAVQHDAYMNRDVTGFDDRTSVPALFAQEEWLAADWLALSGSARLDYTSDHGALASPRISVLLRPAEWSVRVSAGAGHHLPTHWIEDVEAIGLGALAGPSPLRVERARSVSLDVGREIGELNVNVTGFASRISDALALHAPAAGAPVVVNVAGAMRTRGGELLLGANVDPIHARLTYGYTRASEPDPAGSGRREVQLTPRHSAGLVAMWELEDEAGRIGFETYYTGTQALHDNPYRARSRPYTVFGVLAERRIGTVRLFVNLENIGDVRQTRWDPLLLPQRAADGRRTTEAWAPLDGRVINGGVRWQL